MCATAAASSEEASHRRLQAADNEGFAGHFQRVRDFTEALTQPLSPEDCVIQPMPDASPTKWHLAHTTWFWETFLLSPRVPDFQPFHPRFGFLFNSYYNAVGERHARPNRGLVTRPSLEEVYAYRSHVDRAMQALLDVHEPTPELASLMELGWNHEQQHQELILTDIKYTLSCNPIRPAYQPAKGIENGKPVELRWKAFEEGVYWIGFEGEGFAFDNEYPRHRQFLEGFELANRLVTNEEYLAFMHDGGYGRPELWLSDGWNTINSLGWRAPLYWEEVEGNWWMQTLAGMREVMPSEPVCHVSYYEADAFARWAGSRLPTEAEWEVAAHDVPIRGNFVESRRFHPAPASASRNGDLQQLYGDLWEWTGSSYLAYPGYKPAEGALGEYNGKFMCNQMVLRGGSCATPQEHIRPSYRNFFPADARWQFSGIRLARDV